MTDLVGNMNSEIERDGGTRKEKAALALDILAENMIMTMIEVKDLCNEYYKEKLSKCDQHWQTQQNWLRKLPVHALGVPPEFLPKKMETYVHSIERMNEWARETSESLNPTLMRMKLLRAIRVVHENSSKCSEENTGKIHKITGESLVPLLVFILVHTKSCRHLHRSIFLMQFIALQEWNSSSEVAYYLTAMSAALAFICHLEKKYDESKETGEKESEFYCVGTNPNQEDFQAIFSGSSERDRDECLQEMQEFIRSQEAVEDLLGSFGFS